MKGLTVMASEHEYWKKAGEGISLEDYPEIDDEQVDFPAEIHIAYAVSTKDCGLREFIVDGSTQICQYCGKMMYRTAVRRYVLAPDTEDQQSQEIS